MIIAIAVGVVVVIALVLFASCYTVVSPNEAHVIVFMGSGRKIKSPIGPVSKTSYFYIPFLMKRYIMPLTNVKLDIEDIPLNDKEMAPFQCDVVTWLHIGDPVRAAERLDFSRDDVFEAFHQDLTAIVQAIARAASMKQEILDVMRDRVAFSKNVAMEVDPALNTWGIQLVNLEVNEIRDMPGSQVILNYESQRKAQIASQTRILVAQREREAVEAEQDNRQKAEVAKAQAEKTFTMAQIDRDTNVGLKQQDRDQQIAEAASKTNEKKIAALRVSTVGQADVNKQAAITTAEGAAEAVRITGEKEAAVTTLKGQAEGNAIQARGFADAASKLKMAEALQKFNDAGITLEKIRAGVSVRVAYAEALGKIAEKANIKIVTSGDKANILGLPLNAETGADLGQMLEAAGVDPAKLDALMTK